MTIGTLPYAYHVIADQDHEHDSPNSIYNNHRGYEVEMLQLASKIMKFKFKFINSNDKIRGTLVNKEWNGIVKCLVDTNQCDMAIGSMFITQSRTKIIRHTYPFDYEAFTFATGLPRKNEDLATR